MRFYALLALVPLALAAPSRRASPAPLYVPQNSLIQGKYIVKLHDNANAKALHIAMAASKPDHVYDVPGFKGFASTLTAAELKNLQDHPDVDFIEQDSIMRIASYITQSNPPWGLGRISHRSGTNTYIYDDSAGSGTCAYIIDTGIYTAHPEFEGRATFLANFIDNSNTDGNGHGTHVSGTVGSKSYGVAKKTKLYAVKVLDASGSGSTSGVLAGMNFVTGDSQSRDCPNGSVANMSLGSGKSTAVNAAGRAMIAAGVFLAVAAGNNNGDAANMSPASEPDLCTVGASTLTDARASFSNYGTVVDVFAPGQAVLSTWNDGGTNTISGTSMASPHIAGLGAYLLSLEGQRDPQSLCDYIAEIGTTNVLSGIPNDTINSLAFNDNPSG
ncbi:proteinase T-like protein [Xylaria sp. CBS 124048]|nr:proteinase T-like protein [Xylaria sp. CBS 124048]